MRSCYGRWAQLISWRIDRKEYVGRGPANYISWPLPNLFDSSVIIEATLALSQLFDFREISEATVRPIPNCSLKVKSDLIVLDQALLIVAVCSFGRRRLI